MGKLNSPVIVRGRTPEAERWRGQSSAFLTRERKTSPATGRFYPNPIEKQRNGSRVIVGGQINLCTVDGDPKRLTVPVEWAESYWDVRLRKRSDDSLGAVGWPLDAPAEQIVWTYVPRRSKGEMINRFIRDIAEMAGKEAKALADWRVSMVAFFSGETDEVPEPYTLATENVYVKKSGKTQADVYIFKSRKLGKEIRIRLTAEYVGKQIMVIPFITRNGKKGIKLSCEDKTIGTWWWRMFPGQTGEKYSLVRKRAVRPQEEQQLLRAWRKSLCELVEKRSHIPPGRITATIVTRNKHNSDFHLFDGLVINLPAWFAKEKMDFDVVIEEDRIRLYAIYDGEWQVMRWQWQQSERGGRNFRFLKMDEWGDTNLAARELPDFEPGSYDDYLQAKSDITPQKAKITVVDNKKRKKGEIGPFCGQVLPVKRGYVGQTLAVEPLPGKRRGVSLTHQDRQIAAFAWDKAKGRFVVVRPARFRGRANRTGFPGYLIESRRTAVGSQLCSEINLTALNLPVSITYPVLYNGVFTATTANHGEDLTFVNLYLNGASFAEYYWHHEDKRLEVPRGQDLGELAIRIVTIQRKNKINCFLSKTLRSQRTFDASRFWPKHKFEPFVVGVGDFQINGSRLGRVSLASVLPFKTAIGVPEELIGGAVTVNRHRHADIIRFQIMNGKALVDEFFWHGVRKHPMIPR
ncbi:hypothetical protein ACFL31_03010 [Candidatus Margulisiibacteriota bacterium]